VRLFVAVYPPRELQERMWEMGRYVEGSWKREPAEKLHLTLKFLGEIPEQRLKDVDEALKSIKHPSFTVELRGVGVFPSRERPRVIWVGARARGLHTLRELVEDALLPLGIPREWRDFVPHVTLGRAKGRVDVSELFKKYEGKHVGSFDVKEFYLVRSVLKPGGSEYTIIRRYPLENQVPG